MVLQEAFMERNDMRKKISRISGEMSTVLITEEGEIPQFNAKEKLAELDKLEKELYILNCKIDHANKVNVEAIQKLKFLDEQIRNYSNIRSVLLSWNRKTNIGYGEAIKITVKNLDLGEITDKLESLEKERRDVDKALQKSNWQTEI